jgi:Tfp pilus assembly protein PilP
LFLEQEVRLLYRLLQAFPQLMRERQAEHLDAWMNEARLSGIKELQSFIAPQTYALAPIMSTSQTTPAKTAPYLASSIDML